MWGVRMVIARALPTPVQQTVELEFLTTIHDSGAKLLYVLEIYFAPIY